MYLIIVVLMSYNRVFLLNNQLQEPNHYFANELEGFLYLLHTDTHKH